MREEVVGDTVGGQTESDFGVSTRHDSYNSLA
jgi:hypothetical protein